jgi:4-hydroxy-3-methylbut-2-enyl diphosphate reductase
MKVTVAKALGTCFGVQDAIDLAMDDSFRDKLTIIGQLVHNPQTTERLRQNGVRMVNSVANPIETPYVMITAHGAPESLRHNAESMGYKVFDATCPLVLQVHKAVARFVRDGYHPTVIGQADHVEVKGISGDLKEFTIIRDETEIDKLIGKKKIGIVSQTTQPIDKVLSLVNLIRAAFPDADLAREVDLMVVIGGHNSSNTKKLKLVCDEMGVQAYHIERASEIRSEIFRGHQHVGITAGTSTPYEVIEEVYNTIIDMPGVDLPACSGLPDPKENLH